MNAPASIQVYEGSNVTTVARVTLPNGASMFASYIDPDPSILLYVYDITDGSTTKTASYNSNGSSGHSADGNLAHDTAVKTSDTNDGYWTVDSTGYNFIHTVSGSLFTEGGRRYRLEYRITTSNFGTVFVVTEVETKPLYSG